MSPVCCAVRPNPSCIELALEVGEHSSQPLGRWDRLEIWISTEGGRHLRKIIFIIRAQINHALGYERLAKHSRESVVNHAVLSMFAFRPRVGKVNVKCHH